MFQTTATGIYLKGSTIEFEGTGDDAYETILTATNPTSSDKTITLPDATGTVALTSDLTSYIALTNLSVGTEGTAAGDGAIAYDNSTGVFTYTPPTIMGIGGVVADTTPQLGGNLDVNGNSIVSTGSGEIDITSDGVLDLNANNGNVDITSVGGNVTLAGDTGNMTFTNTGTGTFVFGGKVEAGSYKTTNYTDDDGTSTLTTTSATTIDTWPAGADSGEYLIEAIQGSDKQVCKIVCLDTGSDLLISVYGILYTSASPLVTFTGSYYSGSPILQATPASASSITIKWKRTFIN